MCRTLLNGKMMAVLAVALALFFVNGVAEEERTDASGRWSYVLEDGGATISMVAEELTGTLTIPGELDGYAVTGIGFAAFELQAGLTGVIIPDSVNRIGDSAFWGCSGLTSITIPNHVNRIGRNPFALCSLTRIEVSPDNPAYSQIEGILFDKFQKTLIAYPYARKGAYTIPEGVQRIGDAAFELCDNLTGVTMPDSVTGIGEGAFEGCEGLSSVIIPDGVTDIGDKAFMACSGLTSVTIPNTVTDIGFYAFNGCGGLTEVIIPAGVTTIDLGVFYGCAGLAGVTIPAGVTSIGMYAFYRCERLPSVMIPDSVNHIGEHAFDGCSGLASLAIPASVTSIGESAFKDCPNLTLTVTEGSYGAQYAEENGIPCVYEEATESQSHKRADAVLQLAVYPTGTNYESYYFTLSQDGVLYCAVGLREGDDISQPNFLTEIDHSAETLLSTSDLQRLIRLSDELEASSFSSQKQILYDAWDVALLYNGNVYEMNYWENDDSGEFANLVLQIVELSPIPVDLHGWA